VAVVSAGLPATAANPRLAAASERELLALEAEIYQAWEHLGSVCDIVATAEGRLYKWKRKPQTNNAGSDAERAQSFPSARGQWGGLEGRLGRRYERDSAEHTRALSAWEARHEAAKGESGYNRADTLGDLANKSRLSAAKEAMANTRGITIEGSL
jgi:hypothetical protein